jgi:hypothetical protein
MAWLNAWWQNEVVDGYKGPLLLSFVAFVVTFVSTRTITPHSGGQRAFPQRQ